jgi:hypothetical protein
MSRVQQAMAIEDLDSKKCGEAAGGRGIEDAHGRGGAKAIIDGY